MGKQWKTLPQLRANHKPPLTQRELARLLGVDPSTVANWEIGRRVPSLKMAKAISRIFDVMVEDIVFDVVVTKDTAAPERAKGGGDGADRDSHPAQPFRPVGGGDRRP